MKKQDKTKEIFGLHKIPDSAIIKQQQVDIGILKSTIDELEYDLNIANSKLNECSDIQPFKEKISKLSSKVESLTVRLKLKDKEFNARINTLTRKNNAMKQQLFKDLKESLKK